VTKQIGKKFLRHNQISILPTVDMMSQQNL